MILAALTSLAISFPQPLQSGHGPESAIRATQPRSYSVRFQSRNGTMDRETRAVARLLANDALHRVDLGSLRARLWIGSVEARDLDARTSFLQPGPYDSGQAVIALDGLVGRPDVRWEISYDVWLAASEVDEAALARIPWPREWPGKVKAALEHTEVFPATDPLFGRAVNAAVNGPPRLTTPYLVAKQIVGYCVTHVRAVTAQRDLRNPRWNPSSSTREQRRPRRSITWYRRGTQRAAIDGVGSDQDLLAVCITTLRSAGIPARVVVGVHEVQRVIENPEGLARLVERAERVAWGEFYLPAAGWIPFDPVAVRSTGPSLPLDHRWAGFGFVDDLNRRVPLTYDFATSGNPSEIEIVPRAVTR